MGSHRFYDSLPKTIPEIDPQTIEIINVIDRGSYGTVKTAYWKGQEVAVKIFETSSEIEAFRVEVEVLGSVAHTNIIKLYGMSVGVQCFIVMELATQGSLFNLLHKRIDIAYTKEHMIVWWAEIAEALSYLHNLKPKPIIHRDLKSSNILLKDDHVKICDFGTACDVHTLMSNAKGTVAWMAPEVITTTTYDGKCDVYSFGVVMWEVIMRRVPFKGLNSFQIMQTVDNKRRPALPDTVPSSIRTLIQLCWSHDPAARPDFSTLCILLTRIWDVISEIQLPAPCQDITTPPAGSSGLTDIAQPSPPRFPATPGSCSPSPTVAHNPSLSSSTPKSKEDPEAAFRPYQHISSVPESRQLYSQHSQSYEELKLLQIHLNRKKSTVKSLQQRHQELLNTSNQQEASNEGKQLRLSIL